MSIFIGPVSRAWTRPETEKMVFDPVLARAIVEQLEEEFMSDKKLKFYHVIQLLAPEYNGIEKIYFVSGPSGEIQNPFPMTKKQAYLHARNLNKTLSLTDFEDRHFKEQYLKFYPDSCLMCGDSRKINDMDCEACLETGEI